MRQLRHEGRNVFGVEDRVDRGESMRQALSRYTRALGRHFGDELIER